ncbi:poly(A) polymerase [Alkalispirillum mobile]|uniref:Poly(A) polymerase I n=1 Tax=Alkalispirillum mobile TaxID=85925 RepID=A0A498C759_9GAMM|nr:polynucleotide adenylyltransferase PcnB [Alkalispirillum mobile]RLK51193.1 poly(A) polymerase [Alkalispirillum mobile]
MTEQTINPNNPAIIPRDRHRISRADISENALKVLYRLKNAGYGAYLVGGGVRDLSLGHEPKDFDVATDARPEEVRELFRNCRLIGRRFRLAHVQFGREIIEVATFRALHDPDSPDEDEDEAEGSEAEFDGGDGDNGEVAFENGRIVRDNVYGTLEEDALRRDFTINALYYNIADFTVVDHAGGLQDLEQGVIRLMGDAETRYREDPVRMLRAVRFAAKLGFRIHPDTARPIPEMAHLLAEVPPARLFEEVLKLFMGGLGAETFEMLRQHGLFAPLFPMTEREIEADEHGLVLSFIAQALKNTDERIENGKPVTPAFLFAALLWPAVVSRSLALQAEEDVPPVPALQQASAEIQRRQRQSVAIPKRFGIPMGEIWTLQPRFDQRAGKRPLRFMGHPRFRAAYDFLLLRANIGEVPGALAQWWTEFQELHPEQRAQVALNNQPGGRGRRGGRRRRRR